MPETTQVLQLRVSPKLYLEIAEEVVKRKSRGEKYVSLNSVAIDWLEKGKHVDSDVRLRAKGS